MVLEEVQRGCTVVVVSHDHTFVEQEVDGLFHMEMVCLRLRLCQCDWLKTVLESTRERQQ